MVCITTTKCTPPTTAVLHPSPNCQKIPMNKLICHTHTHTIYPSRLAHVLHCTLSQRNHLPTVQIPNKRAQQRSERTGARQHNTFASTICTRGTPQLEELAEQLATFPPCHFAKTPTNQLPLGGVAKYWHRRPPKVRRHSANIVLNSVRRNQSPNIDPNHIALYWLCITNC